MPVRRTLKRSGSHSSTGKGKGGSHSSTGGTGGTCSDSNADKCIAKPHVDGAVNDAVQHACEGSEQTSHISFPGACVGLEDGDENVCQDMDYVTVDKYACFDNLACTGARYTEICESSCQERNSCYNANFSGDATHILTIDPGSCRGLRTCYKVQNVANIGSGSCIFDGACQNMHGPSEDDRTTVGENSCIGEDSCKNYSGESIADDACIGQRRGPGGVGVLGVCQDCSEAVASGQCNVREGTVVNNAHCPCVPLV